MTKWQTRSDDMGQATATYAAVDTKTDESTGPIAVPEGYQTLSRIRSSVVVDGAVTVDVGNIFVVRLSGDAMVDGTQEIIVGGISSQEEGTSVSNVVAAKSAFELRTAIAVKKDDLDISAAYAGTDIGTPLITVSLGFDPGSPPVPLQYRTRVDSMTQATDTMVAAETKAGGGTGAFDIPSRSTRLTRLLGIAVLDADGVVTGANYIAELGGDAVDSSIQEIVLGGTQYEAGGGTVTGTSLVLQDPAVATANIPLKGGNKLDARLAYKGTDPGTPFGGLTLELA